MNGLSRYKIFFVTVDDIGSLYVYLQNTLLNGIAAYSGTKTVPKLEIMELDKYLFD